MENKALRVIPPNKIHVFECTCNAVCACGDLVYLDNMWDKSICSNCGRWYKLTLTIHEIEEDEEE